MHASSPFSDGEGEITRGIIEYGGLFPYNVARLQGLAQVPRVATAPRAMTLAEKILARHWVTDLANDRVGVPHVRPGDEGFDRTDIRFSHEYVTPMSAIFWRDFVGEHERIVDPGSVFFFRDHLTFLDVAMTDERKAEGLLDVALELKRKQEEFAEQQGVVLYGELPRVGQGRFGIASGSEAICHSKILESHALPGHVIIGSDSHTPHAGAIGAFAFGVGTTAVFNSWITRDVRVQVPKSFRVVIRGRKQQLRVLIDISPYKHNGPGGTGAPDWVHAVPIPDDYRGSYKRGDPQAGAKYARRVAESIASIKKKGCGLAGFIAESLPSVGGQIILPSGYLADVYRYVHEA